MIKRPIANMDNRFNKVFFSFDPFNKEFAPGSCLIDTFHSHFSFYPSNKQSDKSFKSHICQLDYIAIKPSSDSSYALVISDASIKNNIATSIAYIHVHNKPIIKNIYHIINVTSMEAELFAIRCGISQATTISGISKIIVNTDSIHATRRIFDSSLHPFEIHVAAISAKLRKFFTKNHYNSIGNILVVANGLFIKSLIKKPNSSILVLSILTSHHGTSARKASVTIFFPSRK